MKKYSIKVSYQTGDSFGSNDVEEVWEDFDNLDIAKENLKRIEEHYRQYEVLNGYRTSEETKLQTMDENSSKPWFVGIKLPYIKLVKGDRGIDEKDIEKYKDEYEIIYKYDNTMAENCIIVLADNGVPYQIWCPWCGYFESLYSAEIITNSSNDLKFTV